MITARSGSLGMSSHQIILPPVMGSNVQKAELLWNHILSCHVVMLLASSSYDCVLSHLLSVPLLITFFFFISPSRKWKIWRNSVTKYVCRVGEQVLKGAGNWAPWSGCALSFLGCQSERRKNGISVSYPMIKFEYQTKTCFFVSKSYCVWFYFKFILYTVALGTVLWGSGGELRYGTGKCRF